MAKHLPLILITIPDCRDPGQVPRLDAYAFAVKSAGGTPVLLPPVEINRRLLENIQGVVLSGGGDIDPAIYDTAHHPSTYGVSAERDTMEIELTCQAFARRIPIIGICRGTQVLTVAFGGKLHAHIADAFHGVNHRIEAPNGVFFPTEHLIRVKPESHLSDIVKSTEFVAISYHHCATRVVPEGWRVSATAEDGAIEAIECVDGKHPCIGLQWHPEISHSKPESQRLFKWLVQQANC